MALDVKKAGSKTILRANDSRKEGLPIKGSFEIPVIETAR